MSFRWFLLVMSLATLTAWVAWIFVLHSVDPVSAGALGFLLFYFSLFVAVLGTSVLLGSGIRLWLKPDEILYRQTIRSLRQGVMLTGLFMGTVWLFALDAVRWWSVLLLIILFGLIELMLVQRRKS